MARFLALSQNCVSNNASATFSLKCVGHIFAIPGYICIVLKTVWLVQGLIWPEGCRERYWLKNNHVCGQNGLKTWKFRIKCGISSYFGHLSLSILKEDKVLGCMITLALPPLRKYILKIIVLHTHYYENMLDALLDNALLLHYRWSRYHNKSCHSTCCSISFRHTQASSCWTQCAWSSVGRLAQAGPCPPAGTVRGQAWPGACTSTRACQRYHFGKVSTMLTGFIQRSTSTAMSAITLQSCY